MEELSKNFGVESTNLFDQAMQMVKEKTNGKTRGTIRWGSKPVMNNSDGTSITITYADKEKFLALADVEVS